MNARRTLSVDTDTLLALNDHLSNSASELSAGDVAAQAIRAWLAANGGQGDGERGAACASAASATAAAGAIPAGYQWKELFLPEGTELRMTFKGEAHHARVRGDAILHRGRRVSPRQLTIAVAGDGRSAWRDLWLRLPGEQHFRPACLLRRNVQGKLAAQRATGSDPAAESPAAAIAAAASMSEALRTALALVDHANAQSVRKYERRRIDHQRRAADVMAGCVAFD